MRLDRHAGLINKFILQLRQTSYLSNTINCTAETPDIRMLHSDGFKKGKSDPRPM